MLSIGFLILFLHWKPIMTLEEAARKLSSPKIDDHKIKTKVLLILIINKTRQYNYNKKFSYRIIEFYIPLNLIEAKNNILK